MLTERAGVVSKKAPIADSLLGRLSHLLLTIVVEAFGTSWRDGKPINKSWRTIV